MIELLVHRIADRLTATAVVDWATDALVAGEDVPSLATLAGLDRRSSVLEVTPWFDKAIAELEVVLPSPAELRRAFIVVVSRAVLSGRVSTEHALDRIHRDVVSPLGHPADLAAWCHLWEGHAPMDYRTLTAADLRAETRLLAADWANIGERLLAQAGPNNSQQ